MTINLTKTLLCGKSIRKTKQAAFDVIAYLICSPSQFPVCDQFILSNEMNEISLIYETHNEDDKGCHAYRPCVIILTTPMYSSCLQHTNTS